MTVTIHTILEEFRQTATSTRDLGDKFERLMVGYLRTDPIFKERFSNVWLWMEWPLRGNHPDTGIDLVAEERSSGDYCAIQCKFYDASHSIQKGDIDSFFTASGKAPFKSRLIVSTTDRWSKHAETALSGQQIPVNRISIHHLANSPIDWSKFSIHRLQDISLKEKKQLRPHQQIALEKVVEGFDGIDRGKLIMACGTGKTFTSLKIAENLTSSGGIVLFLVPSIALLGQTLREWSAEAEKQLRSFAVCSDTKVGKKKADTEDISTHDLAYPATTDPKKLHLQIKATKSNDRPTVIFSTYQSIQVVSAAQSQGLPEFDLIICDEAHRTTGVTLAGDDESHFVKVHDQDFLKAKKRLYMTATPRIFADSTKTQAKESDAVLCSMDDVDLYGEEFHRLGFSEAVRHNLLSDYKVMVLAVDEKFVNKAFQSQIADKNSEINLEDAVKITGCWNGLSKRLAKNADGHDPEIDMAPMHRAVAFCGTIKHSKAITEMFAQVVGEYKQNHKDDETLLDCEVQHVDGTQNALLRAEKLEWLKADTREEGNLCRILSNVRCLSEGVDVPALDAVMFLNPRNSVVDVVQSVGRVMRKSEGKKYGYIILPIGIPADIPPEEALQNNEKYKVVWQVLQALRAHDDRFNATINKIELNKNRPGQIQIIGVGGTSGDSADDKPGSATENLQLTLNLPFIEEWREAIYAKIVVKCGDRRYWESWAKDVAQIAERHITRIESLLETANPEHQEAFAEFLDGLQNNINPAIDQNEAIEMLSQHLITKPVFDALFEDYQFTKFNPVSIAMQKMLDLMEEQALEKETVTLERFYASVRDRAADLDNAAAKQQVVIELYDKFFRTAFPKLTERLGIVYTPVEVVDFIIHSADEALKQEFGVSLSDSGVHILDPFTGTGTFIVRMLQSGLIKTDDLKRKFLQELHANEIVLLAYYIAAVNIEETFHDLVGGEYKSFPGIVLTDTFQMTEGKDTFNEIFPENNYRVTRQNRKDIRVIIGNPPYSAGQTSENDNNKNLKYSVLDNRIRETYAQYSTATNKNSLYDSYIRSFRWASDRIGSKGAICFVTNGSYIDGNAMDGFRKFLTDEFSAIYCFNLRGNQRTSGEKSRKEGGKIFGSGSRASIAITLMLKNPEKTGECQLYYHDIGDYLSREEKLRIVADLKNISGIDWKNITPNPQHDWINQRDPAFEGFITLGDKKNKNTKSIFNLHSRGIITCRDAWVYNFSKANLSKNMNDMISFYNSQVNDYKKHCETKQKEGQYSSLENFIDTNPQKISWSDGLKRDLQRNKTHNFHSQAIVKTMYRPFCKKFGYFNKAFNERRYQMPKIFPTGNQDNIVVSVTGRGSTKDFSVFISSILPDLEMISKGQCFSLYTYEKSEPIGGLFEDMTNEEYVKKDNISMEILKGFQKIYDLQLSKEDIFYYVYGILHSPEYKSRFESDLQKMLPRIPFTGDFWAFSKAGRQLAQWHLNYETVEPYPLEEFSTQLPLEPRDFYRVRKMVFAKTKRTVDKTTIIYNSNITLSGIPLEAYEYIVNGKPAIEWIMERYQYKKDKASQIVNDPNDWSDDPRYILDLVKRIVRVSLETMKIVKSLPALNERKIPEKGYPQKA